MDGARGTAVWRQFYLVSYGLVIYILNLLIGFLSPHVDPEILDGEGPHSPLPLTTSFAPSPPPRVQVPVIVLVLFTGLFHAALTVRLGVETGATAFPRLGEGGELVFCSSFHPALTVRLGVEIGVVALPRLVFCSSFHVALTVRLGVETGAALPRLGEGVMILGFLSLLLTFGQSNYLLNSALVALYCLYDFSYGNLFEILAHHVDSPALWAAFDFFGKPAFLTVSGKLNAETYATALSDVYTFGPTFRAENSNTSRHLAEFWMIEPELAFADLNDDMACASAYLQFVDVADKDVVQITYTEVIDLLSGSNKKFEFPVKWGCDLQSEHERYITEEAFNGCPVIIRDYPKACYLLFSSFGHDIWKTLWRYK
ncbi:hypothetical protein VNO80_21252 [Phaseolus coccineus]|uniref:Aminoacyl-tRNA synthetase class II (D/K/N) domain-containing protein n=1 Tax=Phaseolus coccineus TaxID=3886 RepID=A0AAN9QT44_PHACN